MPATAERVQTSQEGIQEDEFDLVTATADPMPPRMGKDGHLVRDWRVDGQMVEFSLEPYPEGARPRYWYTGVGANLRVKAQRMNTKGIQPVVLNDKFVDGSFRPRNAWEEHLTREFLRANHIDPDKSRDERHPEGPGAMWRCGDNFCNFACPSWHVFTAHQRKLTHKSIRTE